MPTTAEIRDFAMDAEDMVVIEGPTRDDLERTVTRLARYCRLLCDEVDARTAQEDARYEFTCTDGGSLDDVKRTFAEWEAARRAREEAP